MVIARYAAPVHLPAPGRALLPLAVAAGIAPLEDMEYRSRLPVLRHYVENRLASFALAVSTHDTHTLAGLLQSVRVSLLDGGPATQPLDVPGIMAWFSLQNRFSLLTTSNLSVYYAGSSVHYTVTYQVWDTGDDRTRAPSFGLFQGSFDAGPQVWKWTEHTIHPAGSLRSAHQSDDDQ